MDMKLNKSIDILTEQWPKCPFTNTYCDIDIFRSMSTNPNLHCDTCKDYDKNYIWTVKNGIKDAENNPNSNLHIIRKNIKNDGGKYISCGCNTAGLLIGATSTNEDYYWLFIDKDLNLRFSSCVGMYEILNTIPAELSVLDYLKTHKKNDLLQMVKDKIKELKHDILITKIYI